MTIPTEAQLRSALNAILECVSRMRWQIARLPNSVRDETFERDLEQLMKAARSGEDALSAARPLNDSRMSVDWTAGYEKAKSEFYHKGFEDGARWKESRALAARPTAESPAGAQREQKERESMAQALIRRYVRMDEAKHVRSPEEAKARVAELQAEADVLSANLKRMRDADAAAPASQPAAPQEEK